MKINIFLKAKFMHLLASDIHLLVDGQTVIKSITVLCAHNNKNQI